MTPLQHFPMRIKVNRQVHIYQIDNGYSLELIIQELLDNNEIRICSIFNELYTSIGDVQERIESFLQYEENINYEKSTM